MKNTNLSILALAVVAAAVAVAAVQIDKVDKVDNLVTNVKTIDDKFKVTGDLTDKIFVKLPTDEKIIAIDIDLDKTVIDLKNKIKEIEGIHQDMQGIIFATKKIEGEKSLSDFGIQKGSLLHLVLRPLGFEETVNKKL